MDVFKTLGICKALCASNLYLVGHLYLTSLPTLLVEYVFVLPNTNI